ncbi:unnamed protein product [Oikopleura dioica]|uniref:Uncharacterized protein n=1 Tax=Oikopleura dioica TaxID=34765 RepID=E4WWB3_OIKDI|nr:unnamed protein product [Oikopleura dioica]
MFKSAGYLSEYDTMLENFVERNRKKIKRHKRRLKTEHRNFKQRNRLYRPSLGFRPDLQPKTTPSSCNSNNIWLPRGSCNT